MSNYKVRQKEVKLPQDGRLYTAELCDSGEIICTGQAESPQDAYDALHNNLKHMHKMQLKAVTDSACEVKDVKIVRWNLWLDDERDPAVFVTEGKGVFYTYKDMGLKATDFIWCKSVEEAQNKIKELGVPAFMALDHDLGGPSGMDFLHWLASSYGEFAPGWVAHSQNYQGCGNMNSFMESWHRSFGE